MEYMNTKICNGCNLELDLSDFYKNKSRHMGVSNKCKICTSKYNKLYYTKHRASHIELNARKSKIRRIDKRSQIKNLAVSRGGCCDCGELDPIVLQFDHRDPSKKSHNISEMFYFSWNRILEETNKCDVVCANCHIRRTAKQFNWYKLTLAK